jgi:hypothetical protein
MKGYYNALIATLSTAKPSVHLTMFAISLLPLFLIGVYAWGVVIDTVHTLGASMLWSELVHATTGELSPRAKEATQFAFVPSLADIVMFVALGVNGIVGSGLMFVSMKAFGVRKAAGRQA